MPKVKRKRKERLYTRRGPDGVDRYYADFRDLGGGRKALIPEGGHRATIDPEVAAKLAGDQVTALLATKRQDQRIKVGIEKRAAPSLKAFAARHLIQKTKAGRVTENWLERTEEKLQLAVDYFGDDRALDTIGVSDLQSFLLWLQERPGRRGNKSLSGGTQRHYLNALSNLYRRAQAENVVSPGFNPVAFMLEKPAAKRVEAKWLEVHEAALLLESARTHVPSDSSHSLPFMHALLATFLLTGGRKNEILGLLVSDISFSRKTVTFRPNEHRRLKTQTSFRTVPLWPQLEQILKAHIKKRKVLGGLLFASPFGGGLVVEFRKQLDVIAQRAGWQTGEVRSKAFRHTYTAARLQTLDQGAPVSPFTVGRELGHGGMSLVNRVYGHLGTVRHRADTLEYRVEVIHTLNDKALKKAFTKRLKSLTAAS